MTATIATTTGSISYLLFLVLLTTTSATTYDPYFSKTTLFSDYSKMLSNLKIFIYPPPPLNTTTTTINFSDEMIPNPLSLFHTSLLNSPYLTRHPTHATLFFLPFPPLSTRSLARHIQHIRTAYPFWNRSLGADHFYLTRHGVGPASTRNVVELVKNAVQISTFPSPAREFIPHKDLTLPPYFPPLTSPHAPLTPVPPTRYLGYATSAKTFPTLENDDDFLIESATSDDDVYLENIKQSKFCLFNYADVAGMNKLGAALAHGCVPVVISDRPIQDFPLMDIIRWSEIAMFVGPNMGIDEIKRVLKGACKEGGGYERMRGLGVEAAHHMMWNVELEKGEPLDAFEMVIYQLWLRRHSIRYATWDGGATQST